MIDHISFAVRDLAAARRFYTAVLAPLGIVEHRVAATSVDYALDGSEDFGIQAVSDAAVFHPPTGQCHFAFRAGTRAQVDAFFAAALAHGGKDDGRPGLRPVYHPNYYAAFVQDPDGYRIEAVCHAPPRRTLNVLLVEDDALIRLCTSEMLTDLGHFVTEAADGNEAIAYIDTKTFDILLTDISLPGLSGEEVAAHALELHPELRVIFASGYAAPTSAKWREDKRIVMLQKPYNDQRLAAALKPTVP